MAALPANGVRLVALIIVVAMFCGCEAKPAADPLAERKAQAERDIASAVSARQQGNDDMALRFLDASVFAYPTAEAYCERAQIHLVRGEVDNAEQDVFSGLRLDPQSAELAALNKRLGSARKEVEKKAIAEREAMDRAERERVAKEQQVERDRIANEHRAQQMAELQRQTQERGVVFAEQFAKLPKSVDLPELQGVRTEASRIPLPEPPPNVNYSLSLIPDQFRIDPDGATRWKISKDAQTIGVLDLQKDGLSFQWSPKALPANAEELRKAILVASCGGQSHEFFLRRAEKIDAVLLDLTKKSISVPVPAYPVSDTELRLGFVRIEGFEVPTPKTSSVSLKQSIDVILKGDAPAVLLRMQLLSKSGTRFVNIEPLILDSDSKTYPFTADRIKSMAVTLTRDIPRNKVKLAQLENQYNALEAEIRQVSATSPSNGAEELAKAAALDDLQNKLVGAGRNHAMLLKLIPVLERRLSVLPSLVSVGEQVHNSAYLHFRIFYSSAGREIDILETEPVPPEKRPQKAGDKAVNTSKT